MDLKSVGEFIGSVGFPSFIAIFVLIRLEPAIRKLQQSITSLMVVTAKTNGMKSEDVAKIVELVSTTKKRHTSDMIDKS